MPTGRPRRYHRAMTDPDAEIAPDDDTQVERVVAVRLPTTHGEFLAVGYLDIRRGTEQVALVHGDVAGETVLTGVRSVRLLSNNPHKRAALRRHGVAVAEQVPLLMPPGVENIRYLRTKRERLDHDLPHLDGIPGLS